MPIRPPDRLAQLALRVVEHALAQAHAGSVTPTLGLRLALETLTATGKRQEWQADNLWALINEPIPAAHNPPHYNYVLITRLNGVLDSWHYALGMERPCLLKLGKLERLYSAEFLDTCAGSPDFASMCNRYKRGETKQIVNLFSARIFRPFNDGPETVHPRDVAPVVRLHQGETVIEQMSWGFPVILTGKRGLPLRPKPVNNARFDKLNAFWFRWARNPAHRCLIPAASFAEAVGEPGSMKCVWLALPEQPVFAWAGLWGEDDDWGRVFTGVMTDNDPELAWVHDRSPVIVGPADWQTWLTAPLEDLAVFDRAWPAHLVQPERTDEPWWKPKGSVR